GLGMAELEGGGVVELAGLLADRLGDLRPAVAGIHAPQARRTVEYLTAVMGGVVHVLSADEKARLLLGLPVRREGHPEGGKMVGGVEAVGYAISPTAIECGSRPGWYFYAMVKLARQWGASSSPLTAKRPEWAFGASRITGRE